MLTTKIVTHGLMSRVFLMKWYHFSVEYFEDLRNINHCEFLIMNKQESGKYVLENKLRTWSELRRERALKKDKEKEKEKGSAATPTNKESNKLDKALAVQSPITAPRRWGGCPNGCNHDKAFRIRSALAELVKRDGTSTHHDVPATGSPASGSNSGACLTHGNPTPPATNGTSTPSSTLGLRRSAARRFQSEDDESSENEPRKNNRAPQIDFNKAREDVVSSPDGTPSFISLDDRLRAQDLKSPPANGNGLPLSRLCARGRDFGGSYSGQNSRANSDADSSEDEHMRRRRLNMSSSSSSKNGDQHRHHNLKIVTSKFDTLTIENEGAKATTEKSNAKQRSRSRDQNTGRRAMANRLGDSPHSSSNEDSSHHHCCAAHDEHDHLEHEHADDEREKEAQDDIDEADELSDIDKAEREDKSIKGSVY